MKKYGIFGGTFNPPHIGHSIVAQDVKEQLNLDKIIFIPSGNPPLKTSISADHRLAMARLAFSDNSDFLISDIETKEPEIKSYTVNTLNTLNEIYKNENVKLYLIIGADNFISLPKWKEPERLFEYSEVIVISRPEFNTGAVEYTFKEKVTFVNTLLIGISSSMIREKITNNLSVKYLIEEKVEEYITRNKLYINKNS